MKIPKRKEKWSDDELLKWSIEYPVGTAVRYWPVRSGGGNRDTSIASIAWRLPHGTPIVKLHGLAGGVAIDHVVRLSGGGSSDDAESDADETRLEPPIGYYVYETPEGEFLACLNGLTSSSGDAYAYRTYNAAIEACLRFDADRRRQR